MKKTTLKLLTGSAILSTLLLSGCGGELRNGSIVTKSAQPHHISSRSAYAPVTDAEDAWHKDVTISSIYDRTIEDNHKLSLDILFNQGISDNAKHFQVYMNTDNNSDTGWSIGGGEYATTGADYMIEDGVLFKSMSKTEWIWEEMDKIDYETIQEANNVYRIKISGSSSSFMSITDIDNIKNLSISVEPINEKWQDTKNFISERSIEIAVIGENGIVEPNPVEPDPVEPDPVILNETVYEDAENGISSNWFTVLGQYDPQLKGPGADESKGFIKLRTDWISLGNDLWENKSEYHLPMNNQEQTILSIDLTSDGLPIQHYTLGAKVTTANGSRIIQWDSFYNHEEMPAERFVADNGGILIVLPSPVEMVRGYGFAPIDLENNFRVDFNAALKQFEPNNEIISIDTFIATGGNLDNIKLLSE